MVGLWKNLNKIALLTVCFQCFSRYYTCYDKIEPEIGRLQALADVKIESRQAETLKSKKSFLENMLGKRHRELW